MTQYSLEQMNKQIDGFIQRAINLYVEVFEVAGDMVVAHAKETGNYLDHTTRLRSSVGYIVVLEGSIVKRGGFSGEGGEQGLKVAQEFIQGSGVELIIVAGMYYARYVEAKNYNVLTSAEHYAEQIVPNILKQLGI